MKKFLVLYHVNDAARDLMISEQPSDTRARNEAWRTWAEANNGMIVDFGSPLDIGKRLTKDSMMDTGSTVAVYSIFQGETLEDLASRLKDHPHFMVPGDTSIEIFEFSHHAGIN